MDGERDGEGRREMGVQLLRQASYVLPQVPPVDTFTTGILARFGGANSAIAVHTSRYYSAASNLALVLCNFA
jgi:hypothetical protein